jgi:hypothetical protein
MSTNDTTTADLATAIRAIDFSEYVATDDALEGAGDALARQTMWLLENAPTIAAGLPTLGKRGKPVSGSHHEYMIACLDGLFPKGITDTARGKRLTRAFNLARIVAAHPYKDGADKDKYMERVATWRKVATGTTDEVREAIEGKRRAPRPPAPEIDSPESEGSGEGETSAPSAPTVDFVALAAKVPAAIRKCRAEYEKGTIDRETLDQMITDALYEIELCKGARQAVA